MFCLSDVTMIVVEILVSAILSSENRVNALTGVADNLFDGDPDISLTFKSYLTSCFLCILILQKDLFNTGKHLTKF